MNRRPAASDERTRDQDAEAGPGKRVCDSAPESASRRYRGSATARAPARGALAAASAHESLGCASADQALRRYRAGEGHKEEEAGGGGVAERESRRPVRSCPTARRGHAPGRHNAGPPIDCRAADDDEECCGTCERDPATGCNREGRGGMAERRRQRVTFVIAPRDSRSAKNCAQRASQQRDGDGIETA